MGVKDIYSVRTIQKWECREWLLGKHYAHRIPSISYAFGLYQDMGLVGVCTFGTPASSTLLRGVCGDSYANIVKELNRLVIASSEVNIGSFFISRCFKLLYH